MRTKWSIECWATWFGHCALGIGHWDLSSSARQLDHEPGAMRRVVGDDDAAAMLRDNPAYDGEPEAAAPLLGRIVWQKELLAIGERNAGTVVGHRHAHGAARRLVLRLEIERPPP